MSFLETIAQFNLDKVLTSLGKFLDDHVSTFVIQPAGVDYQYLKRWYIFRLKHPEKHPRLHKALEFLRHDIGFELYLHRMLEGDTDRALHDHPWKFVTFILYGGYDEVTPKPGTTGAKPEDRVTTSYFAGDVNIRRAGAAHQVALRGLSTGGVQTNWSLVVRGPKIKEWGFITEEGWIKHDAYLDHLYGKGKWEKEPHYGEEKILDGGDTVIVDNPSPHNLTSPNLAGGSKNHDAIVNGEFPMTFNCQACSGAKVMRDGKRLWEHPKDTCSCGKVVNMAKKVGEKFIGDLIAEPGPSQGSDVSLGTEDAT